MYPNKECTTVLHKECMSSKSDYELPCCRKGQAEKCGFTEAPLLQQRQQLQRRMHSCCSVDNTLPM